MRLSRLGLTGYKNYRQTSFDFTGRIIGICGRNGIGKTNLLDAIHYLCFTKSYFPGTDAQNVHFGAEGFRLEGDICQADATSDAEKIVCIYRSGGKKEFLLDGIAYDKFSHHIGKFPCVMIAPDDIEMITGGSENRRKFTDTLISQIDSQYLQQLIVYNKVLAQRNSFLKNEAGNYTFNYALLDVLDAQLAAPADYIYDVRKQFFSELMPMIAGFYGQIATHQENLSMEYQSQLHQNSLSRLLIRSREKDKITQRTNVGIHKDDLAFILQDAPFKNIASQGQKKSLLFACKLAQFQTLKMHKEFSPILLLDDVFEKLDEHRMKNLLDFVCGENNGQVFITDTHAERLQQSISGYTADTQIIRIEK